MIIIIIIIIIITIITKVKEKMRKIDVITVKGSEVPIGIYTYDAIQDKKFVEKTTRRQSNLILSKGGKLPPR